MRTSMRLWLSAAIAIAAAVVVPAANQATGADGKAKSPKLDRVLQGAIDKGDSSPRRVIIKPRPGHADTVAGHVKTRGNRIEADHRRLQSFTATVDAEGLRALALDPDVEHVSIDAVLTASRSDDDGSSTGEPNVLLASLGLEDTEYDGEKVTIAVIDSGFEPNEDLSGGRGDRFFDFTVDGRRAHAYDDYGHGTHVATLIGGGGDKSEVEVTRYENGKLIKLEARTISGDCTQGSHRQSQGAGPRRRRAERARCCRRWSSRSSTRTI